MERASAPIEARQVIRVLVCLLRELVDKMVGPATRERSCKARGAFKKWQYRLSHGWSVSVPPSSEDMVFQKKEKHTIQVNYIHTSMKVRHD